MWNVCTRSCWIKPDCSCGALKCNGRVAEESGGMVQRELCGIEKARYWSLYVCFGLQTTFTKLHSVLYVFGLPVCVLGEEERAVCLPPSETFQRPRNTGVNMFPTSIDYLSTGWRVYGFMLTYKQPGDWLAALWSMRWRKDTGQRVSILRSTPPPALWQSKVYGEHTWRHRGLALTACISPHHIKAP